VGSGRQGPPFCQSRLPLVRETQGNFRWARAVYLLLVPRNPLAFKGRGGITSIPSIPAPRALRSRAATGQNHSLRKANRPDCTAPLTMKV